LVRRAFNFVLQRPRPNVAMVGGYIAGIYVRSDARRTNVGRALVAAAEAWLQAQGAPAGELHVLYNNEAARLFWQELGYEPLTLGMRKTFEIGNSRLEI
jgi:ribosomal protein S18 acetylase RimI-like enzyme